MNPVNKTIETLSKKPPTNPTIAPTWKRFLGWLLFSSLFLVGISCITPTKLDLSHYLSSPRHIMALLFLTITWITASLAALKSAIPGNKTKHLWIISSASISVWIILEIFSSSPFNLENGFACTTHGIATAIVPILGLYYLVFKAYPTNKRQALSMLILGCGALAMIELQLSCTSTNGWHILIWHGGWVLCGYLLCYYFKRCD